MTFSTDARDNWEDHWSSINLGSSSISRVHVNDDEDEDFVPYKVGFTATLNTTKKDTNESA